MANPRTAPTAKRAERRRKYVTQAEAAEYLGVTARTIRQMIADGRPSATGSALASCALTSTSSTPQCSRSAVPRENSRALRRIRLRQLRRGITPKLRAFILGENDGGAFCHYCGFPAGEVDHIVPVSRGGGVALANLAPACIDCNAEKRDRTVTEWAAWRRANGRPGPFLTSTPAWPASSTATASPPRAWAGRARLDQALAGWVRGHARRAPAGPQRRHRGR